jgi:hypothetical protein
MLFSSGAVADTLERAISIRLAPLVLRGTDKFVSVFILSGRPAGLADVYK